MKVSINDLLKGQRKAGTSAFAEKIAAKVAIAAKEPTEEEVEKGIPVKTFVLSSTSGEIHRGESTVDRVSKPETLREKIARFDRLAARVRQDRQYLAMIGGEMLSPDDENPDDFDFDNGEYVDDFGDIVVTPTQPVEPKVEPETVPVAEPTADPVEADPTPAPEAV